jgi:hypothetical protein
LGANQIVKVEMTFPMKVVATRVYYGGEQRWNIKVNGVSEKPQAFILKLKFIFFHIPSIINFQNLNGFYF